MSCDQAFEVLMGRVFDQARNGLLIELGPEDYQKRRSEFLFHLLDCAPDLVRYANLYQRPESQDIEVACKTVIGFLYHVIPHLKAAGRLLLDEIPDAFDRETASDKPGASGGE